MSWIFSLFLFLRSILPFCCPVTSNATQEPQGEDGEGGKTILSSSLLQFLNYTRHCPSSILSSSSKSSILVSS